LVLFDAKNGRVRHRLEVVDEDRENISSVAFSPDSASVATGHLGGTTLLWDVATGRELRRVAGHEDGAWCMAIAPDGKFLAKAGFEQPSVRLLDVTTGRELARLEGHRGYVLVLAFSPDGRRLATGGGDTTVLTWDVTPHRG
jgi:WD40 repeat protein